MDPNEALKRWREGDDEAMADLADWIRMGGFAPKWTAREKALIYRLLGRHSAPRRRSRTSRARQNPRMHFPKTNRGRPALVRAFRLELYGADGEFLGEQSFKATREKAEARARAAIGKKHRRKEVHRVVLED
jgi:hypothetical protein